MILSSSNRSFSSNYDNCITGIYKMNDAQKEEIMEKLLHNNPNINKGLAKYIIGGLTGHYNCRVVRNCTYLYIITHSNSSISLGPHYKLGIDFYKQELHYLCCYRISLSENILASFDHLFKLEPESNELISHLMEDNDFRYLTDNSRFYTYHL